MFHLFQNMGHSNKSLGNTDLRVHLLLWAAGVTKIIRPHMQVLYYGRNVHVNTKQDRKSEIIPLNVNRMAETSSPVFQVLDTA